MHSLPFSDPYLTSQGKERAYVDFVSLDTLWFNTGTLCNIACHHCYIESSPTNDRLVYLTPEEVISYLDEIKKHDMQTTEIGLTGGEPFMNPHIITILEQCLTRGFHVLVLTNAMKPMIRPAIQKRLLNLQQHYGTQLKLRVSMDHFTQELHEEERGTNTWKPMIEGLRWLAAHHFHIDIAGRLRWSDDQDFLRKGYQQLFTELNLPLDAHNPVALMLFPEMDTKKETPEITTECWSILNKSPTDMMCATSRMVVKFKGDNAPSVIACTLLPYDPQFILGNTLEESLRRVPLNHRHCSTFCVLGGGSCSK